MKLFVFALFVAAAIAAPIEEDNVVDLVVNGVPEGQAVELGDIVDVKVQEHVDGEVVASTDLLHPLTAAGMAEAAAAEVYEEIVPLPAVVHRPVQSEAVAPEPVVMPAPAQPEIAMPLPVIMPAPAQPEVVIPESVVMPAPVQPEVAMPLPVVMPAPAQPEVVMPLPVVMPAPGQPEVVIPEPVIMPSPVLPEVAPVSSAYQIGEIFNDGTVQVNVNADSDSSIISTLQGWFSMVMNYISDGDVKTTQQII